MDKETLAINYLATIETLERLFDDLHVAEMEQAEFLATADLKALELTNEDKRKAYLLINYPKVEKFKKLIKQTQARRDYYRDMITLCTSGLK